MLRIILLLVEYASQYDWLSMMQHLNLHYIRFEPHREHRILLPVLRSALLFEQAAKYFWLFVMQHKSTLLYSRINRKKKGIAKKFVFVLKYFA